jgi:conjugative transfer signal peptidase TraF
MRRRRIIAVGIIAATALGFLATAGTAWVGGFRVNLTASQPFGVWRIVMMNRPVQNGDLVFVCPPASPLFRNALERGYLRRGLCHGGFAPLIKSVVATSGQHIKIDTHVTVDGMPVATSAVRKSDGSGRPVTRFSGGIVPPGFIFLLSPFASSYDSRYFGPVPVNGVLGLARPVLVYDP